MTESSFKKPKTFSRAFKSYYNDFSTNLKRALRLVNPLDSEFGALSKRELNVNKKMNSRTENKGFTSGNQRYIWRFNKPAPDENLGQETFPHHAHAYRLNETEETFEVEEKSQIEKEKAPSIETNPAQHVFTKNCPRHLGYLNQRSKEEKISEDCMVCDKLIDCMKTCL